MAIVKMDQFTLLTFHRHKNSLLKELQKFSDVHFKKLRREDLADVSLHVDFSPEKVSADESELENIRFAISRIEPYVEKPKGLKGLTVQPPAMTFEEFDAFCEKFDYISVVKTVREQDDRANAIRSDISKLLAENENLRAWTALDISPRELSRLKDAKAVLGTLNKMTADAFRGAVEAEFKNVYLEFLGITKDDMAALLILPADGFDEDFAKLKELGFSRVGLTFGDVPSSQISGNQKKIEALESELRATGDIIASLTPQYGKLKIASDYFNTRLERERACENFLKTESVVILVGWVPMDQKTQMELLIKKICGDDYYLESMAVDKDDGEVPVKLKNNRFVTAFEDVTTMYAMPKYNEVDPTPLLAPFYWFFFGFMVGDVGFGLVLMAATFAAVKFCNFAEGMKRFLTFFFYCSFAVVLAGFVYGSFFGFTFWAPIAVKDAAGAVIGQKPILDTQLDIPLMLILSVAIGVVQVIFGLIVKGCLLIRDGHVLDAVFDALFWIVALLGGILWLVGVTGAVSAFAANIGKWCFLGGMIGLALTQGRGAASIGGKIGTSLWEVYGISSYVGDLVSYTRIVALGLSGAYIGFSFIKMSSILPEGILGAICGFIVILIGQTLNFLLGLLGAYVHTCRLQYVEFFGKFFEGGGVPFKPLKSKNNFVQITK